MFNQTMWSMCLSSRLLKRAKVSLAALFGLVAGLPISLVFQLPAYAQSSPNDTGLQEIIVTGSRRPTSSPTDLPSPVTIVGASELSSQGSTNLSEMLRTAVPSFNVSEQPISGTSTTVRPANLRGLSPDQTLVLVNGKRWHRSADISTFGTALIVGSQGVDLESIPAIALKQVEVLRDGAAAQYGADAIAGVMNFILNDDPNRAVLDFKAGQYSKGDGTTETLSGAYGLPLGPRGFITFNGEYSSSDPTNRARSENLDAIQALVNAGITQATTQNVHWGSPTIRDNVKLFVNMATDVGAGAKLYAFGSYAQRNTSSGFFYRDSNNRDGVFTSNGNRLVADLTPNGTGHCPGTVAGGGLVAAGSPADQGVIAAVAANPNCFTWANIFPGGYSPQFGSRLKDYSTTVGIRGKTDWGMSWDVSAGIGRNEITYNISNDTSPSFVQKVNPITSFPDLGSRTQQEPIFNIDLVKDFDVGFHSPLSVAAGYEWHQEEWIVGVGQFESYGRGPVADQGFFSGADGYFGYGTAAAGSFKRQSSAVYLDTEADVTQHLVLGAAARYEDFSDLGSKVIGKLSALVHITDALGIRATASTGFHAPTPAQQNIVYTTDQSTSAGQLTNSGIIPSSNPVAQAYGGRREVPETSTNLSVGIVADTRLMKATLDIYQIEVKNRVSLSNFFQITDAQRQQLVALGLTGADSFRSIEFFTNDFQTKTMGADLIVTMPFELGSGASNVSLATNWNETQVTKRSSITSDSQVFSLENGLPKTRASLTFDHTVGNWRGLARANYYSASTSRLFGCCNLPAGSATTVDLEAGFNVTKSFEISVGGQNVFNALPIDVSNGAMYPISGAIGTRYAPETPWGFNGAFWYARLSYQFK